MIQHARKRLSPDTADSRKAAAQSGVISYRALTLGVGLVAALALFLRFGLNPQNEGPTTSASGEVVSRTPLTQDGSDSNLYDLQGAQDQSRLPGNLEGPLDTTEAEPRVATLPALVQLDQALERADVREQQTAAALKRFAQSGEMAELRSVEREDVIALAEYLAAELSPAEIGATLQSSVGLPADRVLTEEDASGNLVGIYDALVGNHVEEVRPSVLMVTDGADVDGRITGGRHVLPAGTERIYAVFENANALEGLDEVMAVWRNPDDDRMVFTEFEPIRRGSAYNYVWLDVESGWPAGQYQVELFHPEAQSLLLGSEGFSIR